MANVKALGRSWSDILEDKQGGSCSWSRWGKEVLGEVAHFMVLAVGGEKLLDSEYGLKSRANTT